MARTTKHVARLTSPSVAKSPDLDVSPGTKVPVLPADYFSAKSGADGDSKPNGASNRPFVAPSIGGASTATTLTSISEEFQLDSSRQSSNDSGRASVGHRKSSSASVTFRPPRNPSLPQGNPRKTDNQRLRQASPSPTR